MRSYFAMFFCLPLVLLASVAQSAEIVLKNNPFEQPLVRDKSADAGTASSQAAITTLELRATMAAGAYSLANIGGEIVGIGQEINGYRLLAVHTRHVVLEKNDIQKTLSIDNDMEKKQ